MRRASFEKSEEQKTGEVSQWERGEDVCLKKNFKIFFRTLSLSFFLSSFLSPLLFLTSFLFLSPPLPLFGLNLSFLSPGLFCPLALAPPPKKKVRPEAVQLPVLKVA